jgi:hypothetical protein
LPEFKGDLAAAIMRRAYLKLAAGVLALLLIAAIWLVWRIG